MFERKFNNHSGERERERERESPREFIKKWKNVFLRLILKDKGGNQDYLPFC